jgi:uncharacterized membrane-anchored protein YjiN (DUF445 family)
MAEAHASGFDRFNEALRGLDDRLQEVRDSVEKRRKEVEKRVERFRKDVETRLRKSPVYRRVERVRRDVEEQVESTRSQVYDVFGIASKSEVEKLNRKLNAITKKLNELAKEPH